jgi:hypothetical protein
MASKQAKGQKIGRNRDRNPSSRMQKTRTTRNKAKKAQKIVHIPAKINDPSRTSDGRWRWVMVRMGAREYRVYCN